MTSSSESSATTFLRVAALLEGRAGDIEAILIGSSVYDCAEGVEEDFVYGSG